jgi:hypothetical protein
LTKIAFNVRSAIFENLRARINATGRDVTPMGIGQETDTSDHLGKHGVTLQRFGASDFASIDIRTACISSGVDEKLGFGTPDIVEESIKIGVIDGFPSERDKELFTTPQFSSECLTNVTSCSEEEDHEQKMEYWIVIGLIEQCVLHGA